MTGLCVSTPSLAALRTLGLDQDIFLFILGLLWRALMLTPCGACKERLIPLPRLNIAKTKMQKSNYKKDRLFSPLVTGLLRFWLLINCSLHKNWCKQEVIPEHRMSGHQALGACFAKINFVALTTVLIFKQHGRGSGTTKKFILTLRPSFHLYKNGCAGFWEWTRLWAAWSAHLQHREQVVGGWTAEEAERIVCTPD